MAEHSLFFSGMPLREKRRANEHKETFLLYGPHPFVLYSIRLGVEESGKGPRLFFVDKIPNKSPKSLETSLEESDRV